MLQQVHTQLPLPIRYSQEMRSFVKQLVRRYISKIFLRRVLVMRRKVVPWILFQRKCALMIMQRTRSTCACITAQPLYRQALS